MYNRIIIIGNLGKDPDIRMTSGGQKVGQFTVATSESYKDKNGQKQTVTQWHKVTCWQNLADISERFLTKGSRVMVEGKMTYRTYDTQEGEKKYIAEIKADNIRMLGGNSNNNQEPQQAQNQQQAQGQPSLSQQFANQTGNYGRRGGWKGKGVEPDPNYPEHPGPGGAQVPPNNDTNYVPPGDEDLPW